MNAKLENSFVQRLENSFVQRLENSTQEFSKDIGNDLIDIIQGATDRTQNNDASHAKIQGIADRPIVHKIVYRVNSRGD